MTNTCIVFDCMSGDENTGELSHFFRVPRDFELQKKWAQAILKAKEPLTSEHLVCDKHFLESDMVRYYEVKDDTGRVLKKVPYEYPRLTDTAVPSIFPGFEMRRPDQNPEPPPPTIVPDVLIYNNPIADPYTHAASAFWPDVSHDIAGSINIHERPYRPEPADQTTSPNSTNHEVSTVISGPDGNTAHDSTNLSTAVAAPSGDPKNITDGISGNSAPISGDIHRSVASSDGPIDGSTDITAQLTASSGDYNIVGNGIGEQAGIVDTVATANAFFPQNDTATDTMNLVGSISKPDAGWENVIVAEPVSTVDQVLTPFVATTTTGNGCCGNDGNCCCDCNCDGCGDGDCGCCGDGDCGCCGDGDCDGCGDCDCGGCGDCDCGGVDCSGCDCGGCTIM